MREFLDRRGHKRFRLEYLVPVQCLGYSGKKIYWSRSWHRKRWQLILGWKLFIKKKKKRKKVRFSLSFFTSKLITVKKIEDKAESMYLENQSQRWQSSTKGRSDFCELLSLPSFFNAEVKFSVFILAAFERTPTSPDYVASLCLCTSWSYTKWVKQFPLINNKQRVWHPHSRKMVVLKCIRQLVNDEFWCREKEEWFHLFKRLV